MKAEQCPEGGYPAGDTEVRAGENWCVQRTLFILAISKQISGFLVSEAEGLCWKW